MSTPHRLTFFEPRDYRVVFVDTTIAPAHAGVQFCLIINDCTRRTAAVQFCLINKRLHPPMRVCNLV